MTGRLHPSADDEQPAEAGDVPPVGDDRPRDLPDIGLDDGTVAWGLLLDEAIRDLGELGLADPVREARLIVAEATGHDEATLVAHLDDPATVRGVAALDRMVERRREGEPLQYVLGRWGFRTLDVMVDRRVLIPRPETEGVVDHVVAEIDRRAEAAAAEDGPADRAVVVDLGCGSGAIGLAVAAERRGTEVHLVDSSSDAAAVARANLAGLGVAAAGVTVHEGSWFEPLPAELAGRVDVVVSNPPYVAVDDHLPPEVADWEPTRALIAGPEGTEAVAEVVEGALLWLVPGGLLVVEIGETQGRAVTDLATGAGYVEVEVRPDLAGRDRALVARAPA